MPPCLICRLPIDGPASIHLEAEADVHSACLAARLPQDAIIALLGAVVLTVVPSIVLWAA